MSRPRRLTSNQRHVYEFIARHIREKGYAPTHREIADGCGYRSIHSASRHVESLIRKGAIERVDGIARGLILCRDAWPPVLETGSGEKLGIIWVRRE